MATTTQQAPRAALGSGQKSTTDARVNTVRDLMQKSKSQIALALPKYMNADRLMRLAMTAILKNPTLLECDPLTLIGAVIQCAQLGLEPGSSWGAHLVPFWNNKANKRDVQVIPDYRGLMALCRNSEQISTIDAHPVYEKDEFSYQFGSDPKLRHVPHPQKDRGEITHFYAGAKLKDGGFQFVVMMRWEVEEVRDRYSKASGNGPWVTNFDEMGKKTCVRRLVDYLPARIELLTASSLEAKAEQGIPQDLGALLDTGEPEVREAIEAGKPAGAVQNLVDELKGKQNGGTQQADPPKAEDTKKAPEPSLEEEARARELAESQPERGTETREQLLAEIDQLHSNRRDGAATRSGLWKAKCGADPRGSVDLEKLRALRDHLRTVGGTQGTLA